jgi:hypothetical protein
MTPPPQRAWWSRLLVSLGAGLGLGVLVAVVLAVVDLYLGGHGLPLLGRPWLDLDALGVHLSRADLMFLLAVLLGAALAWRGSRPSPERT